MKIAEFDTGVHAIWVVELARAGETSGAGGRSPLVDR